MSRRSSSEGAILNQILALIADRAQAEAKVHSTRTSNDQTGDTEYAKARQALTNKLERLNREAVAEDEKQRRAIVTAGMDGEAKAKSEFGASSRKIAALFDPPRDTAKSDYSTAKAEAAATHDSNQKKAARANAEKSKPVEIAQHMPTRSVIDWQSLPPTTRNSSSIPNPLRPSPRLTKSSAIPPMSSSPGSLAWTSLSVSSKAFIFRGQ